MSIFLRCLYFFLTVNILRCLTMDFHTCKHKQQGYCYNHSHSFIAEVNKIHNNYKKCFLLFWPVIDFFMHALYQKHNKHFLCTNNKKSAQTVKQTFCTCLWANIDSPCPTNESFLLFLLEWLPILRFGCIAVLVIPSNKNPPDSLISTPPYMKIPRALALPAPGFFDLLSAIGGLLH